MAPFINQDLFALLPESLLILIISFLPLKDSIKTSILAKPWRDLWHLRTNIEINEHHFTSLDSQNNHQIRQLSCINFGHSWLQNRNNNHPTISSFTLVFSQPNAFPLDINHYIQFALDHGTKSLKLDFSGFDWENLLPVSDYNDTYSERFTLPRFVYEYKLLESLELVSCHFRVDQLKFLSCALRSVSLGWIDLENVSTVRNLVRNCPLLENLSLFKCFNSTYYVIESASLKSLVMDKCVDVLNITVIAPNLKIFKYYGGVVEFGMNCLRTLEEACLDLGLAGFFDVENADMIIQLLNCFYYAKSLKVCGYITQVLPMALESSRLAGRARIQELIIKTAFHEYEFPGILCLLNSYPLLEKLRFKVDQQQIIFEDEMAPLVDWDSETFWTKEIPLDQNGCVKRTLKHIEIEGFRGTNNELSVLFCLLNHARSLRKLVIRVAQGERRANIVSTVLRRSVMEQNNGVNVVIT